MIAFEFVIKDRVLLFLDIWTSSAIQMDEISLLKKLLKIIACLQNIK